MTARSIPFRAPMIWALLDGSKTQTRRVVKDGKWWKYDSPEIDGNGREIAPGEHWIDVELCPYGQPGGLLWVREAWRVAECYDAKSGAQLNGVLSARNVQYEVAADQFLGVVAGRYRHARFMPRWASRLTLRITDVRVERLQDISEDDARNEGVSNAESFRGIGVDEAMANRYAYRELWQTINGPGSWDANPWVWALTFNVIPRNVDDVLFELANAEAKP